MVHTVWLNTSSVFSDNIQRLNFKLTRAHVENNHDGVYCLFGVLLTLSNKRNGMDLMCYWVL